LAFEEMHDAYMQTDHFLEIYMQRKSGTTFELYTVVNDKVKITLQSATEIKAKYGKT